MRFWVSDIEDGIPNSDRRVVFDVILDIWGAIKINQQPLVEPRVKPGNTRCKCGSGSVDNRRKSNSHTFISYARYLNRHDISETL